MAKQKQGDERSPNIDPTRFFWRLVGGRFQLVDRETGESRSTDQLTTAEMSLIPPPPPPPGDDWYWDEYEQQWVPSGREPEPPPDEPSIYREPERPQYRVPEPPRREDDDWLGSYETRRDPGTPTEDDLRRRYSSEEPETSGSYATGPLSYRDRNILVDAPVRLPDLEGVIDENASRFEVLLKGKVRAMRAPEPGHEQPANGNGSSEWAAHTERQSRAGGWRQSDRHSGEYDWEGLAYDVTKRELNRRFPPEGDERHAHEPEWPESGVRGPYPAGSHGEGVRYEVPFTPPTRHTPDPRVDRLINMVTWAVIAIVSAALGYGFHALIS